MKLMYSDTFANYSCCLVTVFDFMFFIRKKVEPFRGVS